MNSVKLFMTLTILSSLMLSTACGSRIEGSAWASCDSELRACYVETPYCPPGVSPSPDPADLCRAGIAGTPGPTNEVCLDICEEMERCNTNTVSATGIHENGRLIEVEDLDCPSPPVVAMPKLTPNLND